MKKTCFLHANVHKNASNDVFHFCPPDKDKEKDKEIDIDIEKDRETETIRSFPRLPEHHQNVEKPAETLWRNVESFVGLLQGDDTG